MRLTVRTKLIAIVAVDAIVLLALVLLSAAVERRVDRRLASIQRHLVPRIGLEARLEATAETISRTFQDAADGNDVDLVPEAGRHARGFLAQLDAAGAAVDPTDAEALRRALRDYVDATEALTRRLLAGESGEDLVAAMHAMQGKQTMLARSIAQAAHFDAHQLAHAFREVGEAQRAGERVRFALGATCVVLVLILTIWIGRGLSRNLSELGDGFRRFGNGDFETPIPARARDELGDAARQANLMAARLQTLIVKTQRQATELLAARTGLVEKADELARASGYKSQFLANMSHELRTPLNAIIGFSELLHDGPVLVDAAQQKEFLGHVLESGRHLLQLINDILDLSKVEAGKLELHPEPIGLERTIHAVLSILRPIAANRRIEVVAVVDPAIDEVELDPSRFKQILYNYLSNALKFTADGGRVEVRVTSAPDDRFRLEVADTGVGISPDDLTRLFTAFQQVGDLAGRQGGTGLGLALTKQLVEAQGGTVGARSTLGEGSVFHAILPRHATVAPAALAPLVSPVAGAPTVLVIEDNRPDQRKLATALAEAGYSVEVAASGEQALARARARTFDAVTLDLLLPDMTGLEVLRLLRALDAYPQVPIIVITMVAEPGVIANFDVQDVLAKPVDVDALLAALQRANVTPGAPGAAGDGQGRDDA